MDNDLISRSALLAELKEWYNESKQREEANYELETFGSSGIESAMLCVENSPAVDAEAVLYGEWSDYQIVNSSTKTFIFDGKNANYVYRGEQNGGTRA